MPLKKLHHSIFSPPHSKCLTSHDLINCLTLYCSLPNTTPPQQFPAHSLLNYIQDLLSSCSTDTYVIVSQPNVDATDFESPVPPSSLRKIFNENRNIRTSIGVPDVEGRFDTEALQYWLEEKCAAYVWDVQASSMSPCRIA